tara:strand:- start:383 stop:742 length:360 start_codon:yes stop_codon:yes gene_type:complete
MNQEELCGIIMRQTDYSKEQTMEKLKKHNNNVIAVIREYMNPPEKKVIKKTTNQQIFTEIRNLMDDACNNYRIKKEMNEIKNKKIQRFRFIMGKIFIIQKYIRRFLVQNKKSTVKSTDK